MFDIIYNTAFDLQIIVLLQGETKMVFRLGEFVVGAIILLIFVTQIILPVFKGRSLFPFFRKQRQLEKNLADANQAKFEADLEKKVRKITPRQPDSKQ